MRPLSLLLPASLLVLATGTGAQDLPYPQADPAQVSSVHGRASAKAVRVQPDQAQVITGVYAMANGWQLQVRTAPRHIDATIDDQQPLRLYAVAPYRFTSNDGNVTMEFNRGEYGDDMLMRYVPDPRLARVVVISSTLAQR